MSHDAHDVLIDDEMDDEEWSGPGEYEGDDDNGDGDPDNVIVNGNGWWIYIKNEHLKNVLINITRAFDKTQIIEEKQAYVRDILDTFLLVTMDTDITSSQSTEALQGILNNIYPGIHNKKTRKEMTDAFSMMCVRYYNCKVDDHLEARANGFRSKTQGIAPSTSEMDTS